MIRYGFCGLGHRLQKIVLRRQIVPHLGDTLGLSRRMYPRLALRRCYTDGDILQRAAETAHGMALEMREHEGEIVVEVTLAHEILLQVLAALDRERDLAVGIHDLHVGDGREPVLLGSLQMRLGLGPSAAIGGIALHDSASDATHQPLDQRGSEIIVVARLARRDLDGHLARRLATQSLVNSHQGVRRYLAGEIYFRQSRLGNVISRVARRPADSRRRQRYNTCYHNSRKIKFHVIYRCNIYATLQSRAGRSLPPPRRPATRCSLVCVPPQAATRSA